MLWLNAKVDETASAAFEAVTGVEVPYQTLLSEISFVVQDIAALEEVMLPTPTPEMIGAVVSG